MKKNERLIDGKYTYFAFICYTHADYSAAKKLKNKLQRYGLPIKLAKSTRKCKHLVPIFLDNSDMLSGQYEHVDYKEALEKSKYLIVICSDNLHAHDVMVNKEIEEFISYGNTYDKIIPYIICNTEKPESNCFPKKLIDIREKENYNIIGIKTFDPQGKNQYKLAYLKVVARIHDIKMIELEDAHKKRRLKRMISTFSAAFLILLVFLITVISFSVNLWNKNNKILMQNSKSLCRESELLWEAGRPVDALNSVISAVSENPDEPYDLSANYVLSNQLDMFSEKRLSLRFELQQSWPVTYSDYVNNGKNIFSIDCTGVSFFNSATGELEKKISNTDLGDESVYLAYSAADFADDFALIRGDGSLIGIDCLNQTIAWKKKAVFEQVTHSINGELCSFYSKDSYIHKIEIRSGKEVAKTDISKYTGYCNEKIGKEISHSIICFDSQKCYLLSYSRYDTENKAIIGCVYDDGGYKVIDNFSFEQSIGTIITDYSNLLPENIAFSYGNTVVSLNISDNKIMWKSIMDSDAYKTSGLRNMNCCVQVGQKYYCIMTFGNEIWILNAENGKTIATKKIDKTIQKCFETDNGIIIKTDDTLAKLDLSRKGYPFTEILNTPLGAKNAAVYDSQVIFVYDSSIVEYVSENNQYFKNVDLSDNINKSTSIIRVCDGKDFLIRDNSGIYLVSSDRNQQIVETGSYSDIPFVAFLNENRIVYIDKNKKKYLIYDTEKNQIVDKFDCNGIEIDKPAIINGYLVVSNEATYRVFDSDFKEIKLNIPTDKLPDNSSSLFVFNNDISGVINEMNIKLFSSESTDTVCDIDLNHYFNATPLKIEYFGSNDLLVIVCSDDCVYFCNDFIKTGIYGDNYIFNKTSLPGFNSLSYYGRAINIELIKEKNAIVITSNFGTADPVAYVVDVCSDSLLFKINHYKGYSPVNGFFVFEPENYIKCGISLSKEKSVYGFYPFYSINQLLDEAKNARLSETEKND